MTLRRLRTYALAATAALLAGLLAPGAVAPASAAETATTTTVPVNTSEAPRYAETIALTDDGVVFAASERANLGTLKLFYSSNGGQYSFATYPHGSRVVDSVGSSISVAGTGGGTAQAIWQAWDSDGNNILQRATLGVSASIATLLSSGVEGAWPDATFLGATQNTLWWQKYSEENAAWFLATSPVSDPSTLTPDITNVGDGVDRAQFTGGRAVLQYSRGSLPINGKATRIAVFPDSPASSYPTDGNVVGTATDAAAVNALQASPDGVSWMTASYTPGVPNSLSVYIFATAKVSSLSTTLNPYRAYTSYLSDPSGGTKGWILVQEGTDASVFPRGDGPVKAISLSSGATTTMVSRAYGAMPAVSGQFSYYDITNLEEPAIQRRYSSGTTVKAGAVDRRPRTIDAIALAGNTLVVSEQRAEEGDHRLYRYAFSNAAPDSPPAGVGAVAGVIPAVPENVRNRNEALIAGTTGIYTLGSATIGTEEPVSGFVGIDPSGKAIWATGTDGQSTALRAVTSQRLLTRSVNIVTNTLNQYSTTNGASLGDLADVISEGASGPNILTAASNSLGQVKRTDTLLKASRSFDLDSGCTPLIQAMAGAYVLYDCAGTTKVARLSSNGAGGDSVVTAELPSGYTWGLGDGFLGYRSGAVGIDTVFTFGWVDLTDLSNLTLNPLTTIGLADPGNPVPVFAVDATGGQRMVWYQGMTMGIARVPVPASGLISALSVAPGPGLSPNGDGTFDTWTVDAVYNAPVVWRLSITDKAGKDVYTTSATSSDGNVSASWDGRTVPSGPVLADGVYSWKLSAAQPYGSAIIESKGTLILRTVGADAAVSAPTAVFADTFTATWSKVRPAGVSGWDVSWRTTTVDDAGKPVVGEWVPVASATTASSALIGSQAAPLTRGTSVQVRVLPVDDLGVPGRNTTRTVPVAFDDANFTFAKGWAKSKSSAAYFGTLASTSGRSTATRIAYGTTITLYGVKGPKSGSFEVWLNGKKKATITTFARKTANKAMLWKVSGLTVGKHTVQIRPLATSGRPRVILDALLVSS